MKKNKGKLFPSLLTFRFLIVISIPVVLCVSCKKEKETTETTPLSQTPPVVATGDVTNIKYNQATVAVTVSKDGGSGVTKRGICWNKTGSPTLSNFLDTTLNGSGVGSFSANAGALTENTPILCCCICNKFDWYCLWGSEAIQRTAIIASTGNDK